MTGKLRPRGGPMNSGAAADCVVLPNRHGAAALASVADSIETLYCGAVAFARHSSRREAVGEIAADHTFSNFTDSARYVSLWRLRHARRGRKPRRILTSHTSRPARACRARVRCDRRGSVPKVDVTMGMYRGARRY
jgi:hypothetical protein